MVSKSLSIFVATLLSLGGLCQGQMAKIDTSHVSDKSFCVIRIDVKKLVGHLKETKKEFGQLAKMFEDESSLDLTKLSAMTLQFGDKDIDDGEPSFAVTFEFAEAIDRDAFLGKVGFGDFTDAKINGRDYLKSDSRNGPNIYFESKKKFTMATPAAIEAVMTSSGGMGQMSSQVKSTPPGSELVVIFKRTERFAQSVGDITRDLDTLPIPFKLSKLFDDGESGSAYLNLNSGNPLGVKIVFKQAETASQTKTDLDGLVTMGKAALPPLREGLKQQLKALEGAGGPEAMQRDLMQVGVKGLDLGEKFLEGMKISADKKTLEINVQHMGGVTELADMLVFGLQATFFGVSRIEGPGAGIDRAVEKEAKID